MNVWDIVVIAAIVIAVAFAVKKIKSNGIHSCGGNCDNCLSRHECHDERNTHL